MPDFFLLGQALAAAMVAAAGVTLLAGKALGSSAAGIIGVGAGIYVGCAVAGELPRWPLLEDRDRWLGVLLPAALTVEATASVARRRRLGWLLRTALAAAAGPVMLYNTTYVADLAGPGSAEWSPALAAGVFAGLGCLLLGSWGLLAALPERQGRANTTWELAAVAAAAGLAVMLSGYYRGGAVGLVLGVALAASAAASGWRTEPSTGLLGVGLMGVFATLMMGYYFGSLPTAIALSLWLTPLLAWVVEIPVLRRSPATGQAIRGICIAVALAAIVAGAKWRFDAASTAGSQPAGASEQAP